MIDWAVNQHPLLLVLLGTGFTWGMTALGAATVFFFKKINKPVLNTMLGFASGVMIAASFWSLLAPAIEMAQDGPLPAWLVATLGFILGAAFLYGSDKLLPYLKMGALNDKKNEIVSTRMRRSILLIFSITLHNIPEGLAVGVAFGAAAQAMDIHAIVAAFLVAFGIGIQNFPEGAAVSIPLRREGFSRGKSFWYGQLSGLVEPIAGFLGAALVMHVQPILPYALAFAAGAMIYVVAEELIPEAQSDTKKKHSHFATIGCILGFAVMMLLDVALG
ncbi:MAG: ZIP family metal transporter [Christensenellales bacterium]|jgi:ZIP family zinc transporter